MLLNFAHTSNDSFYKYIVTTVIQNDDNKVI